MKRCPQCLFLYPDSDDNCDFDQTALEVVDDSALDSATPLKTAPKKNRALYVVAVIGLIVGVLVVALYFGLSSRSQEASAAPESQTDVQPVTTPSPLAPSPSPSPVASPSPSASAAASTTSSRPRWSTRDPEKGRRPRGKWPAGPASARSSAASPVVAAERRSAPRREPAPELSSLPQGPST